MADSTAWDAAKAEYGGTVARRHAHPHCRFQMNSMRMHERLNTVVLDTSRTLTDELNTTPQDMAFIGVHQVAVRDVEETYTGRFGMPRDRMILTLSEHGNAASASLPLQLSRALESGMAGPGDIVALMGLAAGASAGLMVLRL
ncbi:3-oxoacyl-[acyl-carrier-protein] synthase III C-terminal domain-containing protein [Streptomyces daliensis]|uniref:Beta-ketoacyl-[acyl-carrier-protein] synthase III C-terminal domain-containing protein n=1 Tax=Streptomyces daliensis TaxID=299421 RepID=A0A8T4ILH2_9ACTN|nr:hypothetical protein [Streptomyces daliensis]